MPRTHTPNVSFRSEPLLSSSTKLTACLPQQKCLACEELARPCPQSPSSKQTRHHWAHRPTNGDVPAAHVFAELSAGAFVAPHHHGAVLALEAKRYEAKFSNRGDWTGEHWEWTNNQKALPDCLQHQGRKHAQKHTSIVYGCLAGLQSLQFKTGSTTSRAPGSSPNYPRPFYTALGQQASHPHTARHSYAQLHVRPATQGRKGPGGGLDGLHVFQLHLAAVSTICLRVPVHVATPTSPR